MYAAAASAALAYIRESQMAQLAWRIIIGIVGFLLFLYIVPLLLSVLGIALAANAFALIKICAAIITLWYIIWGPPIL